MKAVPFKTTPMEDAISLADAVEAAPRFRVIKTEEGLCIEPGESSDHLFDKQSALFYVRHALEDEKEVEIRV